jgi:hypothetical protein
MGKAARNRAIRQRAIDLDLPGFSPRAVARALRRHGRLPLDSSPHTLEQKLGLRGKRYRDKRAVPRG